MDFEAWAFVVLTWLGLGAVLFAASLGAAEMSGAFNGYFQDVHNAFTNLNTHLDNTNQYLCCG